MKKTIHFVAPFMETPGFLVSHHNHGLFRNDQQRPTRTPREGPVRNSPASAAPNAPGVKITGPTTIDTYWRI